MTTNVAVHQLRAAYAFVERNSNLVKRYWAWQLVWLAYSVADSLAVSFIGLGMGVIGDQAVEVDTRFLVMYLAVGTLVWRYLSLIFIWITEIIATERWEGTVEYTLMAPIHRITHMGGQTAFAIAYSLVFTAVILVVTVFVFDLDMSKANLLGGLVLLLTGSLSFVGVGIMGSILPLLSPERGQQMTHVIISVMLLVSGVYYPVEVLPNGLRQLAVISPATYVLQGAREAMLNGASLPELWPYIWPTLLIGVISIPLGLWVFKQAENYAKRNGKLHRNG